MRSQVRDGFIPPFHHPSRVCRACINASSRLPSHPNSTTYSLIHSALSKSTSNLSPSTPQSPPQPNIKVCFNYDGKYHRYWIRRGIVTCIFDPGSQSELTHTAVTLAGENAIVQGPIRRLTSPSPPIRKPSPPITSPLKRFITCVTVPANLPGTGL